MIYSDLLNLILLIFLNKPTTLSFRSSSFISSKCSFRSCSNFSRNSCRSRIRALSDSETCFCRSLARFCASLHAFSRPSSAAGDVVVTGAAAAGAAPGAAAPKDVPKGEYDGFFTGTRTAADPPNFSNLFRNSEIFGFETTFSSSFPA